MSSSLNKLFEKGKAKVKQYADQHNSQQQQGYPGQGYPGQQHQYGGNAYPPQQYPPQQHISNQPNQYSGAPYPPVNNQSSQYTGAPYPPTNNHQNQYSEAPYPSSNIQQSQYSGAPYPPPNSQQWSGSPPQNQQWGPPPQQALSPPIPQHSKPQSPAPPAIPGNRPSQIAPSAMTNKIYWKPSFDSSTPVSQNFRHETGDHGWGNNEKQNYTDNPQNSFHVSNRLVVRGLVQSGKYTSARLTSHQTLARPRGYLTATILPPVAEGIWPAYWMLPHDPFTWPTDGEVDIFESWNGDCVNHSCLHWGHYNDVDWNKHQVVTTKLQDMPHQPHTYGFAWVEEDGVPEWRGRLVWYIDGRPVMKTAIAKGTRRMEDYRLIINVAMGGNVCAGKLPKNGCYDLVISDLMMCAEPVGGWEQFERDWHVAVEGKAV